MANKNSKKNQKRAGRRKVKMTIDGAFPPTSFKHLNYADVVTMTEAAAGAGSSQVFRTGDVFDPDYTGVGHQPMYFDQLCSSTGPYLSFSVPKSKFQLRFSNVSSYPVLVSVLPAMYVAVPSSRNLAAERPLAWKKLLAPVGTGGGTVQKDMILDNARIAGVPAQTYIANFAGNFGSSANCPYLIISIWGVGGIGSVVMQVNAVYTTRFTQLGPETIS